MGESPIDFNGLDTTVHGPVRLGVLTALHMDGPQGFTALRKRLAVTDGVLGMHLEKLEAAGYIKATRAHVGRRPQTTYTVTAAGRRAFAAYLDALRRLLAAVEGGAR